MVNFPKPFTEIVGNVELRKYLAEFRRIFFLQDVEVRLIPFMPRSAICVAAKLI